jgi:hypothetical protein
MTFLPIDPLEFAAELWPQWHFYDKQREIIYSVEDTPETIVHAGNMLGKDFVAGFIVLSYYLRYPVVRVITTSVKDDHLRILWGEVQRFIDTCKYPLETRRGGPLQITHRNIKKRVNGKICPISYVRGMVSEKAEGLAGHHAPYTLWVGDEASALDQVAYTQASTWAKRILLIGNCNECQNVFKEAAKTGNIPL